MSRHLEKDERGLRRGRLSGGGGRRPPRYGRPLMMDESCVMRSAGPRPCLGASSSSGAGRRYHRTDEGRMRDGSGDRGVHAIRQCEPSPRKDDRELGGLRTSSGTLGPNPIRKWLILLDQFSRASHNPKVACSNHAPATIKTRGSDRDPAFFSSLVRNEGMNEGLSVHQSDHRFRSTMSERQERGEDSEAKAAGVAWRRWLRG